MSQGNEVEIGGVTYRKTDNKTESGQVIYHEVTGKKGRPRRFIRKQGGMVSVNG